VVLWLSSKVLEDALLPESLHEIPVFNDAMADGVLCGIARDVSLITNVEVYGERERERIYSHHKHTTFIRYTYPFIWYKYSYTYIYTVSIYFFQY
jgi:hypothetical protein